MRCRSALLIVLLLAACGGDEAPAAPRVEPAHASSTAETRPAADREDDDAASPQARVASGHASCHDAQRADPVPPDSVVEGPATIAFGGQSAPCVEVRRGRARVDASAPQLVVLLDGDLHATVPPIGASSRPSLRLATSRGSMVLDGAGEVWITSAPGGTLFGTLRGLAHVQIDPAEAEHIEETALRPGRGWIVGAAEQLEIGDRLAAFADAGRRVAAAGPSPHAPLAVEARLAAAIAERQRGEALAEAQRAAVAARDRSGAAELQRQLVDHARALRRARLRLRVASEAAIARGETLPDGARALLSDR